MDRRGSQVLGKTDNKEKEMILKKLMAVVLGCALITGMLSGCSSGSRTGSTSSDTTQSASAGGSAESSGKVLVVYYSATGSTKAVAETISKTLDADTFEIVPTQPYTDDDLNWNNSDSRVSKEHDDPDSRNVALVSTAVEGWDSYDTVFIGYPIWWGIAAWPVDNFVKDNDFTGKTVIPFCTSASSGIGQSGELLAEMAGTGDWKDGQRFSSSVSSDDVSTWAESVMK